MPIQQETNKPKVFKSSWIIETGEDWKRQHGISKPTKFIPKLIWYFKRYVLRIRTVEDQITDKLAKEIKDEIDKQIIAKIMKDSKHKQGEQND